MSHDHLLAVDGRITDLTLERFHAGELDDDESAWVRAFIASHPDAAERLERLEALGREFDALSMPDLGALVADNEIADVATPVPANNLRWFAPMLAVAAALLVFMRTTGPDDDGIRYRGSGLELQVFRRASSGAIEVPYGSTVSPGDQLGFRVQDRLGGQLVIIGMDATGAAYPVYPADGGASLPLARSETPSPVEAAIELDDKGSWERLVAIRCEQDFVATGALQALEQARVLDPERALPPILDGCAQADVMLRKGDR